jgi:clan AA aspartic protease
MIRGRVDHRYEIRLTIPVLSPGGVELPVEAILDTGFTGALSLPRSIIQTLGLTWRMVGEAVLADGRVGDFQLFDAVVMFDSRPKRTVVYAIEGKPLLGTKLLIDTSLFAQIQVGGRVEIERLT